MTQGNSHRRRPKRPRCIHGTNQFTSTKRTLKPLGGNLRGARSLALGPASLLLDVRHRLGKPPSAPLRGLTLCPAFKQSGPDWRGLGRWIDTQVEQIHPLLKGWGGGLPRSRLGEGLSLHLEALEIRIERGCARGVVDEGVSDDRRRHDGGGQERCLHVSLTRWRSEWKEALSQEPQTRAFPSPNLQLGDERPPFCCPFRPFRNFFPDQRSLTQSCKRYDSSRQRAGVYGAGSQASTRDARHPR